MKKLIQANTKDKLKNNLITGGFSYFFMRIGMAVDYGKYANATSLNLIAKKLFSELGKLMNEKKTFTIAAIRYENIGLGEVNLHYDCISVPNMGGYKFPHPNALSSDNLIIGLSGIDEVILGRQVYKTEQAWKINEKIIEKEVPKWEKYVNKIKCIHVATESEKKQMSNYLKIPENKMHIIPHGVDHELFKLPVNKEKLRKQILGAFYIHDGSYFIHVSENNWARKNVFRILDAFKIAKEKGIKQKLILVGRSDPEVYERARSINDVHVLGYVSTEHLSKLLQGSHALVLPSLHEGFGLPLVEAMACGVPIITSNVFSPPEVVVNAGLLVDPYDVYDLADKMMEMANNEKLHMTLSQNALERSAKFDWKYAANSLLELMEQNNQHKSNFDFAESLDLAAYRTLVTVCQITPGLKEISQQDLLEFNYSRIISWALESGLENPDVQDFLFPFKDWLSSHDR